MRLIISLILILIAMLLVYLLQLILGENLTGIFVVVLGMFFSLNPNLRVNFVDDIEKKLIDIDFIERLSTAKTKKSLLNWDLILVLFSSSIFVFSIHSIIMNGIQLEKINGNIQFQNEETQKVINYIIGTRVADSIMYVFVGVFALYNGYKQVKLNWLTLLLSTSIGVSILAVVLAIIRQEWLGPENIEDIFQGYGGALPNNSTFLVLFTIVSIIVLATIVIAIYIKLVHFIGFLCGKYFVKKSMPLDNNGH